MENEKRSSVSPLLVTFGVVVAILTPLVVFILLRANEDGPGMRTEPDAVVKSEAAKPAERRAIPDVESDKPPARVAQKPVVVPPPATPKPSVAAAKKFPSAGNIPVGMERLKLIETFGRPNMVTTEVNDGRSVETFHYLKPESGAETVVLLRSGRVIEATSSAY